MRKVLMLSVVTLGLLFMVNCTRTSFEKAQLGHWKGAKKSEVFISEEKIYSVDINGELSNIESYKIKSENKKEREKVLNIDDEDTATLAFSNNYKDLTINAKSAKENNKYSFVDDTQEPSAKRIKNYQDRQNFKHNKVNLEAITLGLLMYANDNDGKLPEDEKPAAPDHTLYKEGYISRSINDPITGNDYKVKYTAKDSFIVYCPNPEKYGYKEIYCTSKREFKAVK
ncbi:hypothetical protein J7L48_03725 [bacterium]|nr:hypothetical protein [bacterium]